MDDLHKKQEETMKQDDSENEINKDKKKHNFLMREFFFPMQLVHLHPVVKYIFSLT